MALRNPKPEDVTIIQIAANGQTIYGLGSDQKMYQWNFLDSSWHLYTAIRDTTEVQHPAPEATPVPPPVPPIA